MDKIAEYKQMLAKAKAEARALVDKQDATLEEINAKKEEVRTLKAKIAALEESIDEPTPDDNPIPVTVTEPENKSEYKAALYKMVRGKALSTDELALLNTQNALSSNTGENGGYIIPKDNVTKINELKRSFPALEKYVRIEPVTTLTGSRVLEKDALHTPFQVFTEGDDVPISDSPQFETVSFAIDDRGGILPVPNSLLQDTDVALENYINKWLAKKSVATRNSLILTLLNTLEKVPVADIDDLKDILNVELDPAIAAMSKIFTNQSGFNALDKLKDLDGKYILQPDPLKSTKNMFLFGLYEVVVFSKKIMPNRNDGENYQAPCIIGSLEEAVVLFDREQISLLATNVGGDAFKKNRTDIRAIEREDVKKFDAAAVVFGEINVGASV